MLGAIIGDYVGSSYEMYNTSDPCFPLVSDDKSITDDTMCSLAVALSILTKQDKDEEDMSYEEALLGVCKMNICPKGGYGSGFKHWLLSPDPKPYNSCGNGSAMRVSPVGWLFSTLEETLEEAKKSAECTHNHPEGIKGAQFVAEAIFTFRNGGTMDDFLKIADKYYPDWKSYNKPFNDFNKTCQDTLPLCIQEVVKADDFKSGIRNTILRGGDTDTNAAIVGSILEARFGGVPKELADTAIETIPDALKEIVDDFLKVRKK